MIVADRKSVPEIRDILRTTGGSYSPGAEPV